MDTTTLNTYSILKLFAILSKYEDREKSYYDKNGRFVLNENGEKIYQCAPCRSSYKLSEDNTLSNIDNGCDKDADDKIADGTMDHNKSGSSPTEIKCKYH